MFVAVLILSGQTLIFEVVLSNYSQYQILLRVYSFYFIGYSLVALINPASVIQSMALPSFWLLIIL